METRDSHNLAPASRSSKGVRKRKVINHGNNGGNNQTSYGKNTPIQQLKKKQQEFVKRYNNIQFSTLIILPAVALFYVFKRLATILPQDNQTMIFSCIYYNFTMLAFTSGYHKYFSHSSFRSRSRVLQLYFAIFGSSIGVGSIRWWSALHKAHHQFTDDRDKDPYLIKRGFLWAHWGWLLMRPKTTEFYDEFIENEYPTDIDAKRKLMEQNETLENEVIRDEFSEFENDENEEEYDVFCHKLVLWQEKYYTGLFLLTGLIIPACITRYWIGDSFTNGLVYPGLIRMFICQHSLLTSESVCHMKHFALSIPTQPFSDKNSSLNCMNPLVSLLTYGQAEQNFHHEFPHDYRCTSSPLSFDPTKWFLWCLSKLGLIDKLCITPLGLITQLQIQQQQETINRMKSHLNWGTPISKLPLIKPKEFKRIVSSAVNSDRIYIVIQNVIHDITPFMDQHPGGVPLLKASHGKDATMAFYGGVYGHLTAAVNLLATMRIGILDVGNDEEVWKRVVKEEGEVDDSDTMTGNKLYRSAEAA